MNKNPLLFLLIIIILSSCKKDDNSSDNVIPPPINNNPTAIYTVLPDSGDIYTQFMFDASLSHDVEDALDLLSVRWDFDNDGAWDTQWSYAKTSSHTYSDTGYYSPMLQVRDSDGGLDSTTKQVHLHDNLKTKFEILKEYLIENDMDVDNVISGWITTAENVATKDPDEWFIIDIRSQADFDAGHIEGAVSSTLGSILETAQAATKPILVACYTGQTSGHAVIALRLSGYSDAKVLKWGMAAWNSALTAPWENNIGDAAIGHSSWITPPGNITPLAEFTPPTIETNSEDGASILAERVAAMLEGGFKGVSNADVLATPNNYFISNHWTQADVEHYGHIIGAYRVQPFTLTAGNDKNLDASRTIVIYCWIGHTSSMLTAYLTVLGYDARNLNYGVNSMIYSNLESHKWTNPPTDYPLVPSK